MFGAVGSPRNGGIVVARRSNGLGDDKLARGWARISRDGSGTSALGMPGLCGLGGAPSGEDGGAG